MLVYVQLIGASTEKLQLDVENTHTLFHLKKQIYMLHAQTIKIARILFGGKVFGEKDNQKTIRDLGVYKESCVQVMVKKRSVEDPIPPELEQDVEEDRKPLQQVDKGFGEILAINLLAVRGLQEDTDPYVHFQLGEQTARSTIRRGSSELDWNETFGFHVRLYKKRSVDENIDIYVFNQDFVNDDQHLGSCHIKVDDVPMDKTETFTLRLSPCDATIMVSARRAPLKQLKQQKILQSLVAAESPWTIMDLKRNNIDLKYFFNATPWEVSSGDRDKNAALDTLIGHLKAKKLNLFKDTQRQKVQQILHSQRAVATHDNLSSVLWFSDMYLDEQHLLDFLYGEIGKGCIKSLLLLIPQDADDADGDYGGYGFITFKRMEDAVLALIQMTSLKATVAFGRKRLLHGKNSTRHFLYEGFANVSTPTFRMLQRMESRSSLRGEEDDNDGGDWPLFWIYVTKDHKMKGFTECQHDLEKPEFHIDISGCDVKKKNNWVITVKINNQTYHLRSRNKRGIDGLFEILSSDASEGNESGSEDNDTGQNQGTGWVVRPCPICKVKKGLSVQYCLDTSDRFACVSCLSKEATNITMDGKLTKKYTTADLQDIVPTKVFNKYQDLTFQQMVQDSSRYTQCPNCQCSMEFAEDAGGVDDSYFANLTGVDGNKLSKQAKKHFVKYRIRCRNLKCGVDFCRDCLEHPYHAGLSCDDYKEFKKAPFCRFCQTRVTSKTRLKTQIEAFKACCNKEECKEKMELSSTELLKCGHYSFGIRKERKATPCLVRDCPDRPKKVKTHSDDICNICFVEEISQAPALVLKCGHAFHYDCIVKRLDAGWPNEFIGFKHASCPLCNKAIMHPNIIDKLKPIRIMQAKVIELGRNAFVREDRKDDPEFQEGGEFHGKLVEFIDHNYAFYQCWECKEPYYGGSKECREAGHEINREDLLCPKCQNIEHISNCDVHGTDYLVFKCRYCCTVSVWCCWGTTHFCAGCHKPGKWQKLSEYGTGKNKLPIEKYEQCEGLRERIDEVLQEMKGQPREKIDEKLKELRADPRRCPLKTRHPPNGIEFGMGCSMCKDKDDEKVALHVRKKAQQKREEELAKLMSFMEDVEDGFKLEFKHHGDEEGLLFFFGSFGRTARYENPAENEMVLVGSSEMMQNSSKNTAICGREMVRCVTRPAASCFFTVDLINKFFVPTHYSLRHYSSWDTECLRNWVFQGSIDGETWITLRKHENDQCLRHKGQWYTWSVDPGGLAFSRFRIKQTGSNSNNHHYLACSGFELYGTLHKVEKPDFRGLILERATKVKAIEDKAKAEFWKLIQEGKGGKYEFKYRENFDKNGILYFLGTKGNTVPYENPAAATPVPQVTVTTSGLMHDSTHQNAVVGRNLERCVTKQDDNAWFCVDFGDKWIQPCHYSIRHYLSWDSECLRNWVIEASNDGRTWDIVRRHNKDESLKLKGEMATWPLPNKGDARYSKWRIRMTGSNSNRHKYLACSGMEFYGKLFTMNHKTHKKPEQQISQNKISADIKPVGTFKYTHDFDKNGLMYWLGSRGDKKAWSNPAIDRLVEVTSSGLVRDSEPEHAVVGRTSVRCTTTPIDRAWIMIDLKNYYISPTHYTLRHYSSWATECLRDWIFEGSVHSFKWYTIKEHRKDQSLNGKGSTHTWEVDAPGKIFRYFRIRMTGLNSNDHKYLTCSGFEIYGKLYKVPRDKRPKHAPNPELEQALLRKKKCDERLAAGKAITFKYQYDMDQNGLLYFLGTRFGTAPWQNPAKIDIVKVTSSRLVRDSQPASAIVGRKMVRCACRPENNNWFCVDLQEYFVLPTKYTLRHYSSWDVECLRTWVLEASVDGKRFRVIKEHRNDVSIDGKGATASWDIDTRIRWRAFRIRQTGPNSNDHKYLSLSGFELYGSMYKYPQ